MLSHSSMPQFWCSTRSVRYSIANYMYITAAQQVRYSIANYMYITAAQQMTALVQFSSDGTSAAMPVHLSIGLVVAMRYVPL
jgi:hypothetical protein